MNIILANPNKNVDYWGCLSNNSNLTFDIVLSIPDKPWC